MRKQKHLEYTDCPIEAALDIIGGKWKGVILFRLSQKTCRFNELKRLLPAITQRMLTLQLQQLEAHGIINRKVYAQVPPKVEYSLTEKGKTLEPLLLLLKSWGESHALDKKKY